MEKQISFPFQQKPLFAPTFFQRLFGRQPKENAIIEINNLLAQKDFHKIRNEEIRSISERYKIDLKSIFFTEFFERFYRDYLSFCLQDKHLNDEEVSNLARLKDLFVLKDKSVNRLHNDVVMHHTLEDTGCPVVSFSLSTS